MKKKITIHLIIFIPAKHKVHRGQFVVNIQTAVSLHEQPFGDVWKAGAKLHNQHNITDEDTQKLKKKRNEKYNSV